MTAAEKRESEKLAQLLEAAGIDLQRLSEYRRPYRLVHLQLMQRQVVVGAVLFRYTYIDELLSSAIAWHFFDRSKSFSRHWRTKRFKAFNYLILDQLYVAQKLKLVQYLHPVPKKIASTIMAVNELRNALAHSFFPENRRQKPKWRGKNIFDVEAVVAFHADVREVTSWFWSRGLVEPHKRHRRKRSAV